MRLPVPDAQEVQEFKRIYFEKFGILLMDAEAEHYAIRVVQLYYVLHYGTDPLCPLLDGEGSSVNSSPGTAVESLGKISRPSSNRVRM